MNKSTCAVDDVSHSPGATYAGMCSKHYQRFRKYGSATPVQTLQCDGCGEQFNSATKGKRYCTPDCQKQARIKRHGLTCCICGTGIPKSHTSRPQGMAECRECQSKHDGRKPKAGCKCSKCKEAKANYMREYKDRIKTEHGVHYSTLFRRKYRKATGKHYGTTAQVWISDQDRRAIYERDNWTCHLCGQPVDTNAGYRDNMHPSLDHLIPRSHGGSHDPSNLATAHRICNSIRRDTPMEEYLGNK